MKPPSPPPPSRPLAPVYAGLIAVLVPGLAHALLGKRVRGAVFAALFVALCAAIVLAPSVLIREGRGSGLDALAKGLGDVIGVLVVWTGAAVGGLAVWLTQLIDAVRCARAARQRVDGVVIGRGEPAKEAVIRATRGPQHCPFCHERVEDGPGVACAACLARHHADCWSEHGACSACGGRSRLVAAADDPPPEARAAAPRRDVPEKA